jgi:hypothetical protein
MVEDRIIFEMKSFWHFKIRDMMNHFGTGEYVGMEQ